MFVVGLNILAGRPGRERLALAFAGCDQVVVTKPPLSSLLLAYPPGLSVPGCLRVIPRERRMVRH